MKVLDTIPFSDVTFALQIAKPKFKNKKQLKVNQLTVPYPYFHEENTTNFYKDVYVIPYIEKYFHNMIEIFTNILYLQKKDIKFTVVVVCADPRDYDPKTKLPYGWENNGDANMYLFRHLLEQNNVEFICFPSDSKEYLEFCPRSAFIFFDKKEFLSNNHLYKNYPAEFYFKSYSPHEPCVAQTWESLVPRVLLLQSWAPKYKNKNNKIYITRKNFQDRSIKNEDAIINYLKTEGYEIINFENHTVQEQIRIVQESSHIVLQTGTALLNCLFVNENTKIFEISTATYDVELYNYYFKIMNIDRTKRHMAVPEGHFIVEKLKKDEKFLDAFVAQRTEQDSSKVLVAGSTPAEGAE